MWFTNNYEGNLSPLFLEPKPRDPEPCPNTHCHRPIHPQHPDAHWVRGTDHTHTDRSEES